MTKRPVFVAVCLLAAAACSSQPGEKAAPEQPSLLAQAAPQERAAAEKPAQPEAAAAPVTLVVTGDNWGEIAPCG